MSKEYLLKCIAIYNQHPEANYYLAIVFRKMKNKTLEKKYLAISKQAFEDGYNLVEDNIVYANYPHQVTLYEVEQALKDLQ